MPESEKTSSLRGTETKDIHESSLEASEKTSSLRGTFKERTEEAKKSRREALKDEIRKVGS